MGRDYNFWAYIVTNDNDSDLYTSMTNDLVRRVAEHRGGAVPWFTAQYRCHKLIYYEHCADALDAITREKQIKNWWRAKKPKLVATLNPSWSDLADDILGE